MFQFPMEAKEEIKDAFTRTHLAAENRLKCALWKREECLTQQFGAFEKEKRNLWIKQASVEKNGDRK